MKKITEKELKGTLAPKISPRYMKQSKMADLLLLTFKIFAQ